ncbi:hypothetical protein HN51_071237 [Arachis hypogaea]
MAPFSKKIALPISLLLTLIVALHFNGCESGLFSKTKVEVFNKLPNNHKLGLHCKDKHHDLGAQTLEPNQSWSFRFLPDIFHDVTLYFCRFYWVHAGIDGILTRINVSIGTRLN